MIARESPVGRQLGQSWDFYQRWLPADLVRAAIVADLAPVGTAIRTGRTVGQIAKSASKGRSSALAQVKELPSQPVIPERGIFTAVRTDDGGLYYTPFRPRESHLEVIEQLGIPRSRVVDWGELVNGVFEPFDWRAGLRRR